MGFQSCLPGHGPFPLVWCGDQSAAQQSCALKARGSTPHPASPRRRHPHRPIGPGGVQRTLNLDRLIFYLTTKSIPSPRLKVALHLFFLRKKTGFFSPPSWKVKGLLKIYPSDKKARLQKLQPAIAGVCSTGTSTVPQKLLSDTGIFSIQPAIQLTKQDKQIRRVSASHSQHSSRMQKKEDWFVH